MKKVSSQEGRRAYFLETKARIVGKEARALIWATSSACSRHQPIGLNLAKQDNSSTYRTKMPEKQPDARSREFVV